MSDFTTLEADVQGFLWQKEAAQAANFINAARREIANSHDWTHALEEIATRAIVDGTNNYTLPSDWKAFVEVQIRDVNDVNVLISPLWRVWPPSQFFRWKSIADYRDVLEAYVPLRWAQLSEEGTPVIYTEFRNEFFVFPTPNATAAASYQFWMAYLTRTVHTKYVNPSDTDWFIAHAYDTLKWGALVQGALYLRDKDLKGLVGDMYQKALRDAIASDIEAETSASSLWVGT
jgi:hypothetical protein